MMRCRDGELHLVTAAQFMTMHSHMTTAPLADVLADPAYFMDVRHRLWPFDVIHIARVDRKPIKRDDRTYKILERVSVQVAEWSAARVVLHPLYPGLETFDGTDRPALKARKGPGRAEWWEVLDTATGRVVQKMLTEDDARALAGGAVRAEEAA